MSPHQANSSFRNLIKTLIKLFNKSEIDWNLVQDRKLLSLPRVCLHILRRDEEHNLCDVEFV